MCNGTGGGNSGRPWTLEVDYEEGEHIVSRTLAHVSLICGYDGTRLV
jgi:hypothetical protein